MAVEYKSDAAAEAALKRCLGLQAGKPVAAREGGLAIFESEKPPKVFSAFLRRGRRVGGVLSAESADLAKEAASHLTESLGS